MTDSLKLDSAGLREVIDSVREASAAAAELAPIGLDESCITSDFRDDAEKLASVWREESRATATYLREYTGVLRAISLEMSRVEAELAREAGTP
jgi:hypothetical protein